MGGFVRAVAAELLAQGLITHRIVGGHDWDSDLKFNDQKFHDYPHWQLEPA